MGGRTCSPNVSSAIARLRAFSIRLSGLPFPNRLRSTKNREVGRFGLIALSPRQVGGLVLEEGAIAPTTCPLPPDFARMRGARLSHLRWKKRRCVIGAN